MKFIVTGGGTGGHVYPAIAIAGGLQQLQPGVRILYIGTNRGLEADVVPKAGLPLVTINVQGLERKRIWKNISGMGRIVYGFWEAWSHIKRFKPAAVIGTGGYVSGPVCLAAALQGIPVVLHEQNAYPGITNRLLSLKARIVCLTFPEAAKNFPRKARLVTTGLPVRREIIEADRSVSRQQLKLAENEIFIVVTGGSQGARSINQAMLPVYQEYAGKKGVRILHITGRRDFQAYLNQVQGLGINLAKCGNITIEPYIYKMEQVLSAADLVVGRAGASLLSEILVKSLPSILIPYPHAAGNHQEHNARAVAGQKAAVVVLDKELKVGRLKETIKKLLSDSECLRSMAAAAGRLSRPNALEEIVQVILKECKC